MQGTVGVLGACLLSAAMLGNLFAQAPETPPATPPETEVQPTAQIAEEIRQRLHQPVTIDMKDVPIREAVELVLGKQKIDFWFDERSLVDDDIALDDLDVTCNLHSVSIRAALQRILSQAKLSWVCEDAGVRITTEPRGMATTFPRIYDIADLLEESEVELTLPRVPVESTQYGGGMGGMAGGMGGIGKGMTPEEAKAKAELEAKEASRPENVLMRTIQNVTGGLPDAPWLEVDGEGGSIHLIKTTQAKLLIVRQNEQTHAQIEDLLNELLSHQHQLDGEEAGATRPKTAVKIRTRSRVSVVVKRRPLFGTVTPK